MLIANKKKNIDSAYVYGKKAFYMRPRNLNFYTMSTQLAGSKNDTAEIIKEHRTFITYRNIPQAWKIAAYELKKAKYSNKKLLHFINKGIKQFPTDSILKKTKNHIVAMEYLNEAQYFLNKKNKAKALEFFQKALKVDSSNPDLMQHLAFYYYNIQNYKQSINYFLESLKLRKFNSGSTEFFIANCYLKENDKTNALKYFNISKDKNYLPAIQLLKQFNINNNNQTQLKMHEHDLLITDYIKKGQKFEKENKFIYALKSYEKALRIDPKNIYAAQNIGLYYLKTGDSKKAINYLLNALKYPGLNNGKTEYFLAICYLQQKDKENACKYLSISKSKSYSDADRLIKNICL
jgi:tetratricopeptide (TPR) repeat protein